MISENEELIQFILYKYIKSKLHVSLVVSLLCKRWVASDCNLFHQRFSGVREGDCSSLTLGSVEQPRGFSLSDYKEQLALMCLTLTLFLS